MRYLQDHSVGWRARSSDSVLTATERASNTVMTVCVSGCRTPSLRLDL